ncbi:hypothetical protein BD779DRAFT_1487863 [Infundibulicybe gibba]|nr:hypothetical protein BD779DRAFT_1487863 [Infundibulicybe gibba]
MSGDLVPLLGPETTIKVSSTLNKSVGKKCLIDGDPETCWTSHRASRSSFRLHSPESFPPLAAFDIPRRFCRNPLFNPISCLRQPAAGDATSKKDWQPLYNVYPEDVNRRQSFDIVTAGLIEHGADALKFIFEESSDFFGRITIYDMQLEGVLLQPEVEE